MNDAAIAVIGHNNPPEPTPFDLSVSEAEDLFLEASSWCDGKAIENQEQYDALKDLLGQIKAAIKRADERRVVENEPFDRGKAEVQDRYNTLIGNTKLVKGKLVLADEACRAAQTPWLKKLDDERRAAAAKAAAEAEALRKAAAEAFAKSSLDDLEARQKAEQAAADAMQAAKLSRKAEKQAAAGTGLRTTYSARLVDMQAFARWSWESDTTALGEYFEGRANALVKAGRRDLPGVEVVETREAR